MKRPKLYYLSYVSFSHFDLGILPVLSRKYEVVYGLIMFNKSNYSSILEIEAFSRKHDIKFEPYCFRYRQRDPRLAAEFYKVLKGIKKFKADIIYTTSHDIPILSLMTLTLSKKKTVVSIHDVEFHSGTRFQVLLKIGRSLLIKRFDYFQVYSITQEQVFREKYPNKNVNSIPLTLCDFGASGQAVASCSEKEENVTRFLFFGSIQPYKGLKKLIAAVNSLSKRRADFVLVIAGACDAWESEYEPLIENEKVISKKIGFIANSEVPALFSSAHYLVLPYTDATQSGPLKIAYNYNLPVIASNIEAFRESIQEGVSGYFFDIDEEKGLESVLEAAILRNNFEYELLLEKLRSYVADRFSTEKIGREYELMFSGISGRNGNFF